MRRNAKKQENGKKLRKNVLLVSNCVSRLEWYLPGVSIRQRLLHVHRICVAIDHLSRIFALTIHMVVFENFIQVSNLKSVKELENIMRLVEVVIDDVQQPAFVHHSLDEPSCTASNGIAPRPVLSKPKSLILPSQEAHGLNNGGLDDL